MKKILFIILGLLYITSCQQENQVSDETDNYIEWATGDKLHDEMIWSGIEHFLNIEREKAYVFFEKAI